MHMHEIDRHGATYYHEYDWAYHVLYVWIPVPYRTHRLAYLPAASGWAPDRLRICARMTGCDARESGWYVTVSVSGAGPGGPGGRGHKGRDVTVPPRRVCRDTNYYVPSS